MKYYIRFSSGKYFKCFGIYGEVIYADNKKDAYLDSLMKYDFEQKYMSLQKRGFDVFIYGSNQKV